MSNIDRKSEIVQSYIKLIEDCELAIKNGCNKEENEELLREYKEILKKVKSKENKVYENINNETKRICYILDKLLFDKK